MKYFVEYEEISGVILSSYELGVYNYLYLYIFRGMMMIEQLTFVCLLEYFQRHCSNIQSRVWFVGQKKMSLRSQILKPKAQILCQVVDAKIWDKLADEVKKKDEKVSIGACSAFQD